MVGCDLQRILADAVFRHRCRSKGLCLRSPARRLARPLASATVGVFASAGLGEFRRSGGEQVLRLRAQAGAFRAPARVPFFFCKKKGTKENHLDLRSKDPLARGGQVQIWRYALAHEVRWVTLLSVQGSLVPLAPLSLTAVRVGVGALVEWRLSNRAFAAARRQR